MNDSLVARVLALKTAPTADLKQMWRELFQAAAPPFNRRFLEVRLGYRIQELAHGGLRQETVKRLEKLGEQLATAPTPRSRTSPNPRTSTHRALVSSTVNTRPAAAFLAACQSKVA